MPSSMRLLVLFILLSGLIAAVAIPVVKWQDKNQAEITARQLTGGSVRAGKAAFGRYGCGSCHLISGMSGADGQVGPSLDRVATRAELAGHLANVPANMERWIQHPQLVAPGNGMPETGVSDPDAKDIAAYLYTLR
ncbi:c-type cytochrome [Flavisphingomonas formosensis]|uniref:c-type cytochrome n=1 Tax=Flavisphingomonas formosensis TaxID=861534 RepID=UPI0018DFA2A7|nr:cytochrome c [Sphingomonas formosensis]